MTTVLITGANRGIGLELVRQYAAEGASVHACCRNPEDAVDLKAIRGPVQIHALDVTDEASARRLAETLSGEAIDILINNAGVYGSREHQSLGDMDFDGWAEVFAVNTLAPLRVIQAFLPHIRRAGPCAKIITISSQMGSLSRMAAGSYAYRSSKAAVNKVMQLVSIDLKDEKIIVCPMHPGWVRTDMGGHDAEIDVMESAAGLRRTIAKLTPTDSGKFFQWDGTPLEW